MSVIDGAGVAALLKIRRWAPMFHDELFCQLVAGWDRTNIVVFDSIAVTDAVRDEGELVVDFTLIADHGGGALIEESSRLVIRRDSTFHITDLTGEMTRQGQPGFQMFEDKGDSEKSRILREFMIHDNIMFAESDDAIKGERVQLEGTAGTFTLFPDLFADLR